MLYHDTVGQAQVLAYMDDFWLLAILFSIIPLKWATAELEKIYEG